MRKRKILRLEGERRVLCFSVTPEALLWRELGIMRAGNVFLCRTLGHHYLYDVRSWVCPGPAPRWAYGRIRKWWHRHAKT
jgi:hypothetical protein